MGYNCSFVFIITVVRLKSNLKMRFLASFHYAQNDSDLGDFGHLGLYQNPKSYFATTFIN
jgi:hypothetical protein